MRNFFSHFCYDKNGKLNYDRASKYLGISKNDLYFMLSQSFEYLSASTLMSGVMVGFHPTSKNSIFQSPWILRTCHHSQEDLQYMRRIISNHPHAPDWSTYDYFIMDTSGVILYKNCHIDQSIDNNGVIHLQTKDSDLNHFIYPADRKKYPYKKHFCYGRTYQSLNSHIEDLSSKKIITTPKHFKHGFTPPESEHEIEQIL